MTMITETRIPTHRRTSALTNLVRLLAVWSQRRALKRLDDRALRDIGVSRREADAEASRPVWDAPDIWRD